jgi:D-tyrosyl-tRNA(Tyr) deacylase|tara:strand:- start:4256 stop:4696 length:441 start_codon:yes stop_codon:yes gene_type:complete
LLATVQRVSSAEIHINGLKHASINQGVVIFICIESSDVSKNVIKMKNKIYSFSILEDDINTMSTSLQNLNEDIMIVSQFTLAAITSKGTKPSFHKSAKPEDAKLLYYEFVNEFKKETNKLVEGVFGESMDIKLTNKGPITFNFKVE